MVGLGLHLSVHQKYRVVEITTSYCNKTKEKGIIMKFALSLKKKEVSVEADVEKIVDKELERRDKRQPRKSRYEIKQEEKRKNAELKHKQQMQTFLIGIGILVFFIIILLIMAILEAQGLI